MPTKISVVPWEGGRANVAVTNTARATAPRLPMTPLTRGSGRWRTSQDGTYGYLHEEHSGWYVKHLPTDTWITDLAALAVTGFGSLAAARRWTHTGPAPAASDTQPPTRATVPA